MKFGNLKTQAQANGFISQAFSKRVAISDYRLSRLQLDLISAQRGIWRLRYLSPTRCTRRCVTIGSAELLTLVQARDMASKYKHQLALGQDRNLVSQAKDHAHVVLHHQQCFALCCAFNSI